MNEYAEIYDIIYKEKNYLDEANFIRHLLKKKFKEKINLLEIGAGTGNHTQQLAEIANHILAVEIDSDMAKVGIKKTKLLPNVTWHTDHLDNLICTYTAEAGIALFNVINYCVGQKAIKRLFLSLKKHLSTGGLFIFDTWDTEKLIDYKGKTERRLISTDFHKIQTDIVTSVDPNTHIANLSYRFKINTNSPYEKEVSKQINIQLWSKAELERIIQPLGFALKKIEPPLKNTKTTWYIAIKENGCLKKQH